MPVVVAGLLRRSGEMLLRREQPRLAFLPEPEALPRMFSTWPRPSFEALAMASCGDHLAQDLVFNWRILRADVAGDASDRRIGLTSSSSLRAVRDRI